MADARHLALALVSVLTLAACSGEGAGEGAENAGPGGTPSSGGEASQADVALAATDCYLGLEVPGVETSGIGCSGQQTSSTVTALRPDEFKAALRLTIELQAPPGLGELALDALVLDVPDGETSAFWSVPVDSCVATAVDSNVDEFFDTWTHYRIDFDCAEPFAPEEGNPGAPIDAGAFSVVTFFIE
jgi:hypothetical protein